MLFNTPQFALFFAVAFGLYAVLPHRAQNRLLLGASYVFYAAWDWRFLSLILLSTAVDFFCARAIHRRSCPRARRRLLLTSLGINLGVLGLFKYFDFFALSLQRMLVAGGIPCELPLLQLVLPVGISFYTFQTIGYTVDVYRGQQRPEQNPWDFALYVAFFPQLVAGPIERAGRLLPQLRRPRQLTVEAMGTGAALILLGLFQKSFVADNLAQHGDALLTVGQGGGAVLLGLYCYALRIHGDFAGYSNMARGIALMLGVRIANNFSAPYLAAGPRDFWRRWHITLSTWLRDYLYIPLGGSRNGGWTTARNLALTMLLGGLWHGARLTFIAWGAFHGLLLALERLAPAWWHSPAASWPGRLGWVARVVLMFHLTCLGWLFFQAKSMSQAWQLLGGLTAPGPWTAELTRAAGALAFYAAPALTLEIAHRAASDPLAHRRLPLIARVLVYLVMFYALSIFGAGDAQRFLYYQF